MWGVMLVKGNNNIKEACDNLAWDMINLGLTVKMEGASVCGVKFSLYFS
jgi:hypothetical protein